MQIPACFIGAGPHFPSSTERFSTFLVQGTRSAGVHFEWPKWTKSHLVRSPLRTSLWSAALGCRSNPNRPRGKLILCTATFAAAHRSSVESTCPRRTGPAVGGGSQPAPNPDAFAKEALRSYTVSMSGSGARKEDNPPYLSVGGRCSSAMQGDLRGVPRGERPRRFFGDFLIGEKVTLRSTPWGCIQILAHLCATLLCNISLDTVRQRRYNVHHNKTKTDEACRKRPSGLPKE